MANRIEVTQTVSDTRAEVKKKELDSIGFSGKVDDVQIVDIYTVEGDLPKVDLDRVRDMLVNPVFQEGRVNDSFKPRFDYVVEIGFLPGVTDNVGNTVREGISDLLKRELNGQIAYSSQLMFLSGDLTREDAQRIGESLANPLIQRIQVKSQEEFRSNNGMGAVIPKVRITERPTVDLVDILHASEDELIRIGKQGIANSNGSRRGPLA